MESCITTGQQYILLARTQDLLGWDCFMEGQIPTILIETIKPQLHQWSPRKSIDNWGIKLIKSLINITHKQWIYRNADVHHVIDGLTSSQRTTLFACVQELLMTDINYLLPCHRHLLKQDFQQLGNADTLPRQLWVASMESAISAASNVASGHYTTGSMQVFNSCPDAPQARHNFTKQSYPPTRPPRTRHPVQQTLPSSFWRPSEALPIQPHPAQTHQTDLTGTRYRLHWRRK